MINPPVPKLISGAGSIKKLPEEIKKEGLSHILIVTDNVLVRLGMLDGLFAALEKSAIAYTLFDGVEQNPTIENMEAGLKAYLDHGCDGIVAFGGGSPMDCAKVIGALKSHPNQSVHSFRGYFKIKNELPPLFAVPTTAGTGSEVTVAAVVKDAKNHEKFGIGDKRLVPKWAILDPDLTVSLPPHITAATGMDALTHAVESYISRISFAIADEYAEKAVRLILANLENAYDNGSDIQARNNMLLASYYAGLAFTRTMVGYVHAIAHNLGGLYGIPHGLANATILPYILDYSRKDAQTRLARLAVVANIGEKDSSDETLSTMFIDRIRQMNTKMGIPSGFKEIREEDIPLIVKRTMAEAAFAYAPPTLMSASQCDGMIRKLIPG
ncbi:MAG: iron-containing alcohol dehydrogenase [Desulfatitalea sp.]|nr:iron-containing alcohol dehydrogenase [Desulfatitalea sp.]NNJ98872.1 iron-containing alcohol dehydrogenase [Desulfatitalea sp.]